jgi:HAD superfamily hydrolase (TIGR01509 family)
LKPKVVVFDLGKVLVDFDYGIATRRLASLAKVPHEEIAGVIDQSPLLVQFETGLLDNEQFYGEVCAATGFCGDQKQFDSFFADIFTPIDPMIDLHAQLRRANVPTYIFSNTNGIAVRHIRNRFPFFANFTGYILSYEHGAMKPDPKIYQMVEKITGASGSEILYLDDRSENVETGSQKGWQVVLHHTPNETIQRVRELGLI